MNTKKDLAVTITRTNTLGVWKISKKGNKSALLIQPMFAIQCGIEPSIDQAIDALRSVNIDVR